MPVRFIGLAFLFFILSCRQNASSDDFFSLRLTGTDGKAITLSELKTKRGSLFFFLSPDCPLSQKYSLPIKNYYSEYGDEGIGMYLVFPGQLYSSEEINGFLSEYELSITSVLDTDKKLTRMLGAAVTPESFLLDSAGKVVYKGAIDNWFVEAGKKREVVTEHYLTDALESFLSGKPIKVSETKPVGCIIE